MKKICCGIIIVSVIMGAAAGYLSGAAAVYMLKNKIRISCLMKSRAKHAFKEAKKKVNF